MAGSSSAPGGPKVLVVDDNAMNLKVTQALLDDMGLATTLAANGSEALACLAREPFDVVLMDIEMPVMNGLEASRRLRAGEAGEANRHVRILALSGHTNLEYRRTCREAGMDGYLVKPVRFDDLENAVHGRPTDLLPRENDTDPEDVIQRFGGRGRILARVAGSARKIAQAQLKSLQKAVAEKDLEKARLAAHTLAGTFGAFFMDRAMRAAKEAEKAAAEADLVRAGLLVPPLAGHVGALLDLIVDNSLDTENT